MSDSKNLRIAGIFITMAASAFGFGIPYIYGAPKDHAEAVSTRWMSLKAFSAGVILSVAFVHLLGESLNVLAEIDAAALAAEIAAEEAEGHHEEEEEEGHGHGSFPWGITLCLAGAAMTLGIEIIAGIFVDRRQTNSSNSENTEGLLLTQLAQHAAPDTGKANMKICDDPYRLEHGHSHSKHEEVHCHAEHDGCASNGAGSTPKVTEADSKVCPETEALTVAHDHAHTHGHANGSHVLDLSKAGASDIHRHVSIVVEDERRSVLKSLLLEAAVACHSVIIGVSLGGTEDYKAIGVLLAAFTFHQIFEGISLGSASLQAGYSPRIAVAFMLIFALSVPVGMLIGLNVPKTTQGDKVQAWFGCIAAGSLIYTALVEMVADDFSHLLHAHASPGHGADGSKVVKRVSAADSLKALYMYLSFVAGLASMTMLAKWA